METLPDDGADIHLRCPKCHTPHVKAASLAGAFVYLRCTACSEVWSMPERREFRRAETDPARTCSNRDNEMSAHQPAADYGAPVAWPYDGSPRLARSSRMPVDPLIPVLF